MRNLLLLILQYSLSQFAKHPWVLFFLLNLCVGFFFFLFAIRHSCSLTCWEMNSHIWSFQGECRERNLERRCSTGTLIWQAGKNMPPSALLPGVRAGSVTPMRSDYAVWSRRCAGGLGVRSRETGATTSALCAWAHFSSPRGWLPVCFSLGTLEPTERTRFLTLHRASVWEDFKTH